MALHPQHNVLDNSVLMPPTGQDFSRYYIQGKMLTIEHILYGINLEDGIVDPMSIKKQMCMQLALAMLEKDTIYFTSQQEVHTDNTIIRARIFVVPSNKVQILTKEFSDRIQKA